MSVDPLKSRPLPASDTGKVASRHQARRSEPGAGERGSDVPAASGDSVELSAASRGMVDRAGDAPEVPRGALPADRMQAVLRRLADGHYDRPEVREELARRVGPDVANSRPE